MFRVLPDGEEPPEPLPKLVQTRIVWLGVPEQLAVKVPVEVGFELVVRLTLPKLMPVFENVQVCADAAST